MRSGLRTCWPCHALTRPLRSDPIGALPLPALSLLFDRQLVSHRRPGAPGRRWLPDAHGPHQGAHQPVRGWALPEPSFFLGHACGCGSRGCIKERINRCEASWAKLHGLWFAPCSLLGCVLAGISLWMPLNSSPPARLPASLAAAAAARRSAPSRWTARCWRTRAWRRPSRLRRQTPRCGGRDESCCGGGCCGCLFCSSSPALLRPPLNKPPSRRTSPHPPPPLQYGEVVAAAVVLNERGKATPNIGEAGCLLALAWTQSASQPAAAPSPRRCRPDNQTLTCQCLPHPLPSFLQHKQKRTSRRWWAPSCRPSRHAALRRAYCAVHAVPLHMLCTLRCTAPLLASPPRQALTAAALVLTLTSPRINTSPPQVPVHVFLADSLPKGPTGKISRRFMVEAFMGGKKEGE